jgi:hypothetical protein
MAPSDSIDEDTDPIQEVSDFGQGVGYSLDEDTWVAQRVGNLCQKVRDPCQRVPDLLKRVRDRTDGVVNPSRGVSMPSIEVDRRLE